MSAVRTLRGQPCGPDALDAQACYKFRDRNIRGVPFMLERQHDNQPALYSHRAYISQGYGLRDAAGHQEDSTTGCAASHLAGLPRRHVAMWKRKA